VDQRLAVEAEPAAVHALAAEAVRVLEVVVGAVEHVETVSARCRDGCRQPVERGAPIDRQVGARLLDEIVGADDQAGEPRAGATASSRSRIRASAGKVLAFSSARALEPGMYSTLRRGRMCMISFPSSAPLYPRQRSCRWPVRTRRERPAAAGAERDKRMAWQ